MTIIAQTAASMAHRRLLLATTGLALLTDRAASARQAPV